MKSRYGYTRTFILAVIMLIFVADAYCDEGYVIVGDELELVGKIIITIDDCSNQTIAEEMFTILDDRGLDATFFCNSFYLVDQTPDFWIRVIDAGWEFGYHTTNHTRGLTYEELDTDFDTFEAFLRDFLQSPDLQIAVTRPPWGDWNDTWLRWTSDRGLYTVRWNMVPSVDAGIDYFRDIVDRPQSGPIILLHTRPFDRDWLRDNIDALAYMVTPVDNTTFPTVSSAINSNTLYQQWNLTDPQ